MPARHGRLSIDLDSEAGFTLLEMVCVLAIVALLASLVLPAMPLGTSRQRLQAYALETASLLKADRSAAIRRRVPLATRVDVGGRVVRSAASGRTVRLPKDVRLRAVLPRQCAEQPAASGINFFPSGMSCGGTLMLAKGGAGYEVRVNWLTGGVDIVPARG
ncbi:pilus assembly FimT family protein [Terrihabitans sp. B22-R8]|uniref:pilus assembly FimT family protein n=1 Tax=Terrihabitans sp. B22-R8 TaxID=3425128 RepID=UPI00403C9DBC